MQDELAIYEPLIRKTRFLWDLTCFHHCETISSMLFDEECSVLNHDRWIASDLSDTNLEEALATELQDNRNYHRRVCAADGSKDAGLKAGCGKVPCIADDPAVLSNRFTVAEIRLLSKLALQAREMDPWSDEYKQYVKVSITAENLQTLANLKYEG
ncbi:MAG: hypothetical protein H0X02_07520 [Nitrosomonas sp.]|nr:hypothetical protein [Nitrosomonas sp.]